MMQCLPARKSNHFLLSVLMLMTVSLFLAGCGEGGHRQSAGSLEADGDFSTSVPFSLEKIPAGSVLTAELVIDGGAPIPMTVNGDNVSVTTPELEAGNHSFTITYFLDGKRIASVSTNATIIAGQSTAITFEISQLDQDLDKDGFTGIDEVIAGSDPDDALSLPQTSVNQAPNGVINTPATNLTILPSQSVNFTATGSDQDNNTPLTFVWNFGGGATNSSLEDPGPVTFNTLGTFTVTFTVTDSTGLSDPTPGTRIITVKVNQAPNGVMNAPATDQVILKGQGLTFNGSGTDPDGDLDLDFLWNFGGGAADSFFENPGFISFAATGLFPVRMTATDSLGLSDPSPAYRVVGGANQRKLSATQISAGGGHTCAIVDDGAVKCWGNGANGQLGFGSSVRIGTNPNEMGDNLATIDLGTGRSALAISANFSQTCVILDDDSLKCWGRNDLGQLGQGDTADRGDGPNEMGDNLPPINLGTGRSALAVSVGTLHTCALLDDKSVKCWGSNADGELGQGDTVVRGDGLNEMGDNLPPINLGTGRSALAISAGEFYTCALLNDSSVKCWGSNLFGQLGQGDTNSRGDGTNEMGDNLPPISLGIGRSALAISAGTFVHTCALLDDKSVKCWGSNADGELGQGDTVVRGDGPNEMGDNLPPINLGTGRSALAILAGTLQTCALLDDANVKCWGDNRVGQLGQGDINQRGGSPDQMGDNLASIDLGTGRSALLISVSDLTNCVLLDNAKVKCWGENASGQLGKGDQFNRGDGAGEMGGNLSPVSLGTGHSGLAISAGGTHICTLLDNASVKCWGGNTFGQLGQGNTLSLGNGPGEMGENLFPINFGTGRSARAISAGIFHNCALLDNASVKCWGENFSGQLGQGDTVFRGDNPSELGDNLLPVNLGAGRSALVISAGEFHTCALLDDASVKCWGSNLHGQLGQGDTSGRGDGAGEMGDSLPPVDLGTGRSAHSISVGRFHSCVLLDDASVKCWGNNFAGQLGQGDTAKRGDEASEMGDNLSAIKLGTGRSALAISAGRNYSCALLDDNTVKCWGRNFEGQLGQDDINDRGDGPNEMGDNLLSVNLGTGRSALAISAAGSHTCALLDDASVKCWGANFVGQLGQGDTIKRGDEGGPGGVNSKMGNNLLPIDLGSGRSALAISAKANHSCAILDDASIKCWGRNFDGQLGQGDTDSRGDAPGEMGGNLFPIPLGIP